MIDILVYLFETYGYADACPEEPEQLTRKLAAVGFEEADIADAVEWLGGLRLAAGRLSSPFLPGHGSSIRIFIDSEQTRLDVAARGFLVFLESVGLVDLRRRELIIERALALPDSEVTLSQFKVIVLMVLWQERANVDALILDELLTDEVAEIDDEWQEALSVH
jgi:Smg protein